MGRNLSTVPYVQEGQAVSAAWANQLVRELRNQPAYNAQMQIPKPPDTKPPCAFGYIYAEDGKQYLQGGVVVGGQTNEVVPPEMLSDSALDDTYIFLEVNCTANSADGVLLSGIEEITSIRVGSSKTIPANVIPKVSSTAGKVHITLGQYRNKRFLPYGCGNFIITHCPGSISYSRDIYE